ncbi:hypothetical protein EAG_14949 [Camponotus floridanus]|uniref:Uncharacterized protein n=1 Tax=Camponotus floridanus TaxID=104421 RepID=E2ATK4_CAMFO|nr:hypothetical protein EAG_14949 [Camponotus floridanus]
MIKSQKKKRSYRPRKIRTPRPGECPGPSPSSSNEGAGVALDVRGGYRKRKGYWPQIDGKEELTLVSFKGYCLNGRKLWRSGVSSSRIEGSIVHVRTMRMMTLFQYNRVKLLAELMKKELFDENGLKEEWMVLPLDFTIEKKTKLF